MPMGGVVVASAAAAPWPALPAEGGITAMADRPRDILGQRSAADVKSMQKKTGGKGGSKAEPRRRGDTDDVTTSALLEERGAAKKGAHSTSSALAVPATSTSPSRWSSLTPNFSAPAIAKFIRSCFREIGDFFSHLTHLGHADAVAYDSAAEEEGGKVVKGGDADAPPATKGGSGKVEAPSVGEESIEEKARGTAEEGAVATKQTNPLTSLTPSPPPPPPEAVKQSARRHGIKTHRFRILMTLVAIIGGVGVILGLVIYYAYIPFRNWRRKGKRKANGRGYYGIDDDDADAAPDFGDDGEEEIYIGNGQFAVAGSRHRPNEMSSLTGGGRIVGGAPSYGATASFPHSRSVSPPPTSGALGSLRASNGPFLPFFAASPPIHHGTADGTVRSPPCQPHRPNVDGSGAETLYVYRSGSNADVGPDGHVHYGSGGESPHPANIRSPSSGASVSLGGGSGPSSFIVGDSAFVPAVVSGGGARPAVDLGPNALPGALPRVHGGAVVAPRGSSRSSSAGVSSARVGEEARRGDDDRGAACSTNTEESASASASAAESVGGEKGVGEKKKKSKSKRDKKEKKRRPTEGEEGDGARESASPSVARTVSASDPALQNTTGDLPSSSMPSSVISASSSPPNKRQQFRAARGLK